MAYRLMLFAALLFTLSAFPPRAGAPAEPSQAALFLSVDRSGTVPHRDVGYYHCAFHAMYGRHAIHGRGMGQLLRSSGDTALDTEMRAEIDRLNTAFRVKAALLFLDDRGEPNAFATNQTYFPRTDGTLIVGRTLLWDILHDRNQGGAALMGILAHEMGHILQYSIGLRMEHTSMEQHADFMAGYYMGAQQPRRQFDLRSFASSLYSLGDYNGSHGTPRERVQAMLAGYEARDRDLRSAIQEGVRFAQRVSTQNRNILFPAK